METQTYIECKKNSHGSVLYVYSQSPRSEEDPQLLEEIILPESSDDVYKIVNNDKFIAASFVNHGTQIVPGTGGVMIFKKRNDGKFHFIQTIKLDSEKVVITDENQLNFGIDLELTDENLFITCSPTIEDGDKHSYIGIYEYGEFFWELVQEFYGADADSASFQVDEFAYDQLTGKSIYGGINSLAATTTDFVFCSNVTESEKRPQNQKGLYSCIKVNGTWLLDVENPILHPQYEDDVVGDTVVGNSTKIIGKPCMYGEWLSVSSYKCIKNSELENKLPNEDSDAISFIPCVLIYKKDDEGMFKFFQYLEYEEKCRLSVISEYENITVQMRGDHLVCYDENNLNTTLQEKVEAKYFYLDRTEKVRIGSFGKTYCWKYDSDFNFDGLKKPFVLGGCPPCLPNEASCGQVLLHLQSTDSEEVVSDVCQDINITDINHRSPMCDLYLNNIENELGYVFNPLTNLTEDVTIDYTQAHNQNASNRWVTYGNYTNLPIELTPRFLSPDSQLRFVHMSNTSTWQIIDPYNHTTGGMRGLEGTLRSTGMNQGALTYTFAKPTMVIAVTSLVNAWNHGAGIIGSWTKYTPRWEADRTCWTVYYKFFEAGDHVITNQGFFLYFRPLDLIPTPTPTPSPERTPTPTPERTPTPTPTYILHDMIMLAGSSNRDGLVLISWDGQNECLPFLASGKSRRFIVPDAVTQINVQCWGAGGGNGKHKYAGGAGGYAEGKIDVTPGELYIIGVGQTARGDRPRYSPGGSAGAGGTGMHRGAGAGGGMSGIFKESISSANALIIAGGGGGSSGSYQNTNTGAGGGGGTNGGHGMRYSNDNSGGRGGSQTSGGRAGYCLAWSRSPQSGSRFRGGRGGTAGHSSGGGGGAGWFGGGGGGALMAADSAGGGGSGYIHESVIDGKMYRGDSGRARRRLARSHLPKPMPCEFVMPTPTPERTPTPTPDCPKIYWDIVDDDGNTISKESSTISLNTSKLDYGQQTYRNILTGMVGASNDARVIRWGVKDYSSVSNIKLILCDESEHDPLETEFITYSAGDDKTGLRMNLTFGVELTPTPIPQPSSGDDGDGGDGDDGGDSGEPTQPIDRPEITASTCETQYLLLQPATDDTAILDKGSETFDVTEKGETKLNSVTKYFDLPTIKVANGDESYPPNNTLETNIGDMIIGTNDFTIETFIKFDDVNQDHRIIDHNETSRNRSSWLLYHRGNSKESSGEEGRWFQWLVNNGHGSGSEHNNWVNHIAFLSPISLENNTWYHIALVRKNVTNWAFYVNGSKHERLTNRFMHSSAYSFGSYSGSIPSFSGPTYIGYNRYSTSGAYYMQSFRVANVAVYTDEFNVPSSTLGAIDFKPMCENVVVDLQKSDSDDSIEDKSASGISVTSDVSISEQTTFFRSNVGRVRVFNYENEKWELKFQEKGEVLDTGTALGYDMSASKDGNIFAFSTPYYNTDTKSNVGKVTIYESTGSSFTKRAEIIGDVENKPFGMYCELSVTGEYLVLSKALETYINQVYVYKWDGSDYVLRDTINGAEAFDQFGGGSEKGNLNQFDISENGNILVVGAYSSDSTTAIRANAGVSFGGFPTTPTVTNFGRATVYKWSNSSQKYVKHGNNIIGTSIGANAGKSVLVSRDGSTFIVGAPGTNTNGAATEGSIKIFNITDTGYELIQEIKGDGSYNDINLGYTFELSANGNILVIGKSYNQKVVVYEKNDASEFVERNVILGASLDSNVSGGEFNFGSKVSTNSDGSRIVISHSTSDVVADSAGILYVMDYVNDDYVLLPNTIESLSGESLGGTPFQISDDGLKLIASSSGYDHRETKQTSSFSGSSSDIIVVGNNSDLNFLHNGTTDYTIEFDLNATDLTGTGKNLVRLFSNVVNSSGSVAVDCFVRSNGELTFNIHRGVLGTAYKSFVSPEGTISVNTDYKIAIVFSGGQIKIFINGIAITNKNNTAYSIVNSSSKSNASRSLIIGGIEQSGEIVDNFKGSITNFKIVRSALYNCNYDINNVSNECIPPKYYAVTNPDGDTKLLIRSTTSDGIKDIGCQNRTLSINGDTAHTESSKLFDTGTINFDGSDSISIPNSKDAFKFLHSGVGADFTVESWIKITQANQYQTIICTASHTGNTGFMLVVHGMKPSVLIGKSVGGRWRLYCGSNTLLNLNTWHHVAVVNVNGKVKLFVDGKLTGESEFFDTIISLPTHNVSIGCEDDHRKQNYFVGQLQDLRISSSAVYSGRFVVPNALFTTDCSDACSDPKLINCANDVLLHLQSNTFKSSDPIVDSSVFSRALTKYGDVTHNTSKSPFGRSSLYFDGDGDYLSLPASNDWKFADTDFTLEAWVNFDGIQPSKVSEGITSTHGGSANLIQTATNGGLSDNVGWGINLSFDDVTFYWEDNNTSTNYQGLSLITTATFEPNVWVHIAVVKHNNTITGYVNGETTDSKTITGWKDSNLPLEIGRRTKSTVSGLQYYFKGYLQDLRITNKAVYTTCFSKPTSMLEIAEAIPASEPSCGEVALNIQSNTTTESDAITDISVNAHSITKFGDVKHSSAETILGASSLYFDGNGDYLIVENSDDFNFGSSDYTVELFIYTPNTVSTNTSNVTQIIGKHTTGSATNSAWVLLHVTNSKEIRWQAYSGETSSAISVTIPDNKWVHIAIVQSDNTLKMYKDGVLESETTMHGSMNISTSRTLIGAVNKKGSLDTTNYAQMFSGYLQDLRISKKAVYTGCFVPPASLHTNLVTIPNEPSCDEVALNIQSDTTNEADAIEDISVNAHAITKYGNVKHSSAETILGASSLYFDGKGDYLSINNLNNFGAGDFTIEFWIYQSEFSQNNVNNITQVIGQYMAARTYHNIWNVLSRPTGLNLYWNDGNDEENAGASGGVTDPNFSLNTWTHYAFVRKDTVLYMYSNGQLVDKNTIHTKTINECPLTVGVQMYDETLPYDGTRPGGGIQYPDNFKGYLQDIRISNKAVYTGCFNPPTSLFTNLVTTPNEPSCDEVALNIQSDTDVKRSVTLQWYMLLPNHSIANHRNGTLSHSQTFDITEDVTKVDQWFMYSNSWVVGANSGNWTASAEPGGVNPNKANLTYNDTGETIVVDLTNRKLTSAKGGAGHNLTFNFDVPYGKELPSIEDISVNTHAITKHGDVKHSSAKTILGASSLYFDGVGDYLQIEDNSLRNLHNGANDFTIECWINISNWITDTMGNSRANILGTGGSTANSGIWLRASSNGFAFRITKGISGITEVSLPSGTQVNLNTWYHVAVSYNSDTYKLFVDGILVNESAGNHSHSSGNSYTPFRVGRFSWPPDNNGYFKGYLQDLRISNKAIYNGCFKLPTTFLSEECTPTPTPLPQPTPTPVITRGELEVTTAIGSSISTIKQTNGDFKVGDCVIIGRGTDKEEHLQISQITSSPITEIKLHFSTEIQNVHSAGTLIETVDCGSATLPLPSDDYIQFTMSDIANGINLDFNRLQGTDNQIEGSITIDYGDGERDVLPAVQENTNGKSLLRKTFSELKERTITVFGEIRDMTFNGNSQITSIIVKGMSSINNGWGMFSNLHGMTSCDVSEFDTKNITMFVQMFYGCKKVATLDVSSFDTSKSTTFRRMFADNEVLESINLSSFVTSKCEDMSFMFSRCFLLTTLNLASFDTSEVLDMQSMFNGCHRLTGLNLNTFNTSKVTNMQNMFASTFKSTAGNVAPGITLGSNFNTSSVTSMFGMFNGCAVASLDLSQFDTSKVESMGNMFAGGFSLKSLNVSSFDTSSVVDMAQMFENCEQLTSLNLEHFDTRKVTSMQSMFGNAAALGNLQISSWDTRSVSNMYGMFRNAFKYSSSNVTLDLSMWDVRAVAIMDEMFKNTSSKLTNVSLENWCLPLIDSKPRLWNGNDQYGTAPVFSQEPTWGDTECAYCCPDNYEYLITTGSSTSTRFELTLDSGLTEVVFVYSGFDDGGKLCVNFEQPDGSFINEDEEFMDVSINDTIVGTVTKALKNGADNNIIYYTNSDGCFSGEYKDDSGTVIMTEVNAPTPTPIGSIPEFTAENLCQYESGRFEDFSGSYICVNKPLFYWNDPSYKYTRFITNGLYEYDGMVNGKPSYKLENEYGVSKIEWRENYDSNYAVYTHSGNLNDELTELSQVNGGYSAGFSGNAGSFLRPKTEWKTYNSRKNKSYPWCDFGDSPVYTLLTDPDECVILDPTPTPTPTPIPTPTPTEALSFSGDDTLASTTSTTEAAAGTKVIEIPDSDTSKFSANMEIVIAPDDDTKREENVIDSIGSLYLKNELQNTHPAGTRIVEKATSNNEDGEVGAPIECPDGKIAVWQLPNGDPCNPNQATLKTFFGLSMNLNNEWENVFNGLSIKFGEQETANGVDYIPIYAKVDNDKISLSSANNLSEWNKLLLFVGDNKNPANMANGEGLEYDTIVSDNLMLSDQQPKIISANVHFRFQSINGIPTLQIKNIKKPLHPGFENRDTENDWSSVYVGKEYDLNDDVWPTVSVDVNYEIGPITYSSLECNQICVDEQTPTPTNANYLNNEENHPQAALDAYNQTTSPTFVVASNLFTNFGLVFAFNDTISEGTGNFKIIVDDDSDAPDSAPVFVTDTKNNEYRLYVNSDDLVINTLGSYFAFYEWDSEQNEFVTYGTDILHHYYSGNPNTTYWQGGNLDVQINDNYVPV